MIYMQLPRDVTICTCMLIDTHEPWLYSYRINDTVMIVYTFQQYSNNAQLQLYCILQDYWYHNFGERKFKCSNLYLENVIFTIYIINIYTSMQFKSYNMSKILYGFSFQCYTVTCLQWIPVISFSGCSRRWVENALVYH